MTLISSELITAYVTASNVAFEHAWTRNGMAANSFDNFLDILIFFIID